MSTIISWTSAEPSPSARAPTDAALCLPTWAGAYSLKALVINSLLAWKTIRRERPDLIVSTGAAVAVPFFYIGKLFGAKTVYIEVFDRIDKPTMTGKLVYPITDTFVVQWEEMKQVYPKAVNLGSIF